MGGAAFGVAYLTAYSAFALFGYVPSATGLALLALVSAGAGVYAVTRGAMAKYVSLVGSASEGATTQPFATRSSSASVSRHVNEDTNAGVTA